MVVVCAGQVAAEERNTQSYARTKSMFAASREKRKLGFEPKMKFCFIGRFYYVSPKAEKEAAAASQ
jgi:hypothetical protein